MSREALDALRARVNDDPALALELAQCDDERFTAEVVRRARERDLDVTPEDVAAAIGAGRRAWTLRGTR